MAQGGIRYGNRQTQRSFRSSFGFTQKPRVILSRRQAGRDGLPANAWMTYGLGDVVSMRQMLMSGDAPDERKRVESQKLDALLGFCESTECRHQTILRYFGEEHPRKSTSATIVLYQ